MQDIDIYKNRPTRAIISLPNLRHNFSVVKTLINPKTQIMGIVKADAYGHGIFEVTKTLLEEGASSIGVAYLEEAIFLRKKGIKAPILVLGGINTEQIPSFLENDIELTSSSLDKSKAIAETAKKINKKAVIHLKIDTGMERIGVHWHNAQKFIEETYALPNLEIKGIFSHLATADTDESFTKEQIKRFNEVLNFLEKKNLKPNLIHLCNSSGITNYPEAHYNLVRPGIILYGYSINKNIQKKLNPVMTLKSKVSYFKVVPENTGISYDLTHKTKEQTRIITLPIGYGDGYRRLFSNKAEVMIKGKKYPVVGTVCMDQTMVSIGQKGEAYNGDDVLLFGEDNHNRLTISEICKKTQSSPYEILCGISKRVPRIYID